MVRLGEAEGAEGGPGCCTHPRRRVDGAPLRCETSAPRECCPLERFKLRHTPRPNKMRKRRERKKKRALQGACKLRTQYAWQRKSISMCVSVLRRMQKGSNNFTEKCRASLVDYVIVDKRPRHRRAAALRRLLNHSWFSHVRGCDSACLPLLRQRNCVNY